jgi:hypothetical protein
VQRKLAIGASNDPLEKEADRVADQVMATPALTGISDAPPQIQRYSGQLTGQMDAAPASVDQALASPGRALAPLLRQDMESRFGHDFSRVRVHRGEAAEKSAQDVNAQAYTVGDDIVFGASRFVPASREGLRLIAHELTHVVQQRGGQRVVRRRILYPNVAVTSTDDPIPRYMRGDGSLALTTLTINGSAQITPQILGSAFNPTEVEPKSAPSQPLRGSGPGSGSGSGAGSGSGTRTDESSGSGSGAGSGNASGAGAATVQCGFKDFDVSISANIRLPSPPADGRWGPEMVERAGIKRSGLPPKCSQKNQISVVMKGDPNSGDFYQWMKTNEDQHASDMKKASDEILVPDHNAVLSLRGAGANQDACKTNLYDQLRRLPDNIQRFLERVGADIAGRDVPGGHKFDATFQERNDCDNLSILLKKAPPPATRGQH